MATYTTIEAVIKKGKIYPVDGSNRNAPFPAVIPNVVRNLQLGKRREAVQSSRRFLVAALLGMTKKGLLGMTKKGRS
jgi:hypothetical protein